MIRHVGKYLVLAAVASVLMGVSPTGARAGALVLQPDIASGSTWGADGWAGGVNGGPGYISLQPTMGTPGTYMWIKSFKLPATVNLDNITVRANWSNGHVGLRPFGIRLCQFGFWDTPSGAGCVASNGVDRFEDPENGGWPANYTLTRDRAYVCGVTSAAANPSAHCAGLQFEITYPGADAGGATLSNARVQLSDYTKPTATTADSRSEIESGRWLRGTIGALSTFSDTQGLGVAHGRLHLDGHAVGETAFSCNLSQWVPCPESSTYSTSIDTTSLEDGPHNGYYSATDIADNTGRSGDFSFKVDNTEPDAPSNITPQTDAMSGWSANNSFGASWTNTGEELETATKSGIARVVADINPTDASQSDPPALTIPVGSVAGGAMATRTSVSGLSVPSVGKWSLRLSLIDKAGNVSPIGDGTGGTPDSDVTIGLDPDAPLKPAAASNGWLSRDELGYGYLQRWTQPFASVASSPICGYSESITDDENDSPGASINLPGATTNMELPHDLAEGRHWLHLRSVSCAGVPSAKSENVETKVDRTDPIGSYTGVEEGHWYRNGQSLVLGGSDALSGMEPAAAGEPAETGAYITYSINGDTPQSRLIARGPDTLVTVTGEGEKVLKFSPVDSAGNAAPSTTVKFGIDATEPEGYFEPQDPDRPTLLRAALSDGASGIENAWLQVRNARGGGAWMLLPTSLASFTGARVAGRPMVAVASAQFPDTKLPVGTYEVRLVTSDQAGNQLITTKDRNGAKFTVENPMRSDVHLTAALFRGAHRCKSRRGTKCVKKRKGGVYLEGGERSARVGFKRAAVLRGYLSTTGYAGLGRQPLEIYTREPGKPEELAGTTATRSDGSYYYRLKPGVNRKVRVFYPGTNLLEDDQSSVSLGTAAQLRLRVSRRHTFTGGSIRFSGRVRSFDGAYPASRKIIALQFYSAGKWRPAVAIARTDAKGRFSIGYRFDRIPRTVKARIKFRVMAPAELGWNHVTSASKRVLVVVN